MNKQDIDIYISQRLVVAGHNSGQLFTHSAKNFLYSYSKGIPRIINLLCTKAILISFHRRSQYVEIKDVKKSIKELGDLSKILPKYSGITSFFWEIFAILLIIVLALVCLLVYNIVYNST